MVLVDSSVWIDHFNGIRSAQVEWLRAGLEDGIVDFVVGDLIVQEVLQGFRSDADFARADRALGVFPCLAVGGRANCVAAARMYRRLRSLGITVRKPVDVLIGAFCISGDVELLHDDRDFEPIAAHFGLRQAGR